MKTGSSEFFSEDELASRLRADDRYGPRALIGIDGFPGAGKSRLAEGLAGLGLGQEMDVDDFLPETFTEGMPCSYVKRVDHTRLAETVSERFDSGPVLLSGVCLLRVIERTGLTLSVLIYVKEMQGPQSLPYWKEHLDLQSATFEEEAARQTETLGRLNWFDEEILHYHYEIRPHERADFIFARFSDGS